MIFLWLRKSIEKIPVVSIKEIIQGMVLMGTKSHSIKHQVLNTINIKGDLILMDQIEKEEVI